MAVFPIMLSVLGALILIGLYFAKNMLAPFSSFLGMDLSIPRVVFATFMILFTLGVVGNASMMAFSSWKLRMGLKLVTLALDGAFIVMTVISMTMWSMVSKKIVALFFTGVLFMSTVYMFVLIDEMSENLMEMRRGERVGDRSNAGR